MNSKLVALILLCLSGCTFMETQRITETGTGVGGTGQFYMLPKALIPVRVIQAPNGFRVDVLDPIIVGDPDYQFALNYVPSSMSNDTIKIIVDSKTSLLKTLDLQTQDQTAEVMKKIAVLGKTTSESAELGEAAVIFSGLLDPEAVDGTRTVGNKIRGALRAFLVKASAKCATDQDKSDQCSTYGELMRLNVTDELFSISARPFTSNRPIQINAARIPGNLSCGRGICHRGAIPYQVTVKMAGTESSTALYLPNGGPILSLPLKRHPFVTTKHDVTIVNGMVTEYTIAKPSSALALVAWPMDVYKAFIDTTKEIIQLKIDTSKKNVDLETQRVAEATALADLRKQLAALEAAKSESAALTSTPRKGTVISVGIGSEQFIPPTDRGDGNDPIITPDRPIQPDKQGENEQPGTDGTIPGT